MMRSDERIGYFGKIHTRSDFVKVAHDVSVMGALDDWLAQVMSELPSDARWKINYDALQPVAFAFVGPRRQQAVAGHIVASHDQSGRRFPFLMMRALDVLQPAQFVSHCPLALEPLWKCMAGMTHTLLEAPDPTQLLSAIAQTQVGLDQHCGSALSAFLATSTVSSLNALLWQGDARRLILALGMLLQPVMQSRTTDLEKSLVLPLPDDRGARYAVASFWMELIAPFLRQADLELALFLTRSAGRPVLVVGFRGAYVQTLQAMIDPLLAQELQISFADTSWVDEQLGVDVNVRALASYLDQPQMPLTLARELFLQTFIGAAP